MMRNRWLIISGIGAVALGLPTFFMGFMMADDLTSIGAVAEAVRGGWGHLFDRLYGSPYRPVLFGYIAANHAAWGIHAAGWRATLLLLEGCNALAFAWLLQRTGVSAGWAAGAAMLWAAAPVRLEPAVLDAVQKVLATTFTLGAMACGWRWLETGRAWWLCLSSAAFGLGVFGYPVGIAVPIGLLLVQSRPGRGRWMPAAAYLPWALAWLCAEVVAAWVLGESRFPSSLDQGWVAPAWFAKNVVSLTARALLPFGDLDVTDPLQRSRWIMEALLKLAVVGGVIWTGLRVWRLRPAGRFWIGWLAGAVGFVALRWVADGQHLALIGMGLAGLLSTAAGTLTRPGRGALAVGMVLVGLAGLAANARTVVMGRSASVIVNETLAVLSRLPAEEHRVTLYNLPRTGSPPGAIVYANEEQIARSVRLLRPGDLEVRTMNGPVPSRRGPGVHYAWLGGHLVAFR